MDSSRLQGSHLTIVHTLCVVSSSKHVHIHSCRASDASPTADLSWGFEISVTTSSFTSTTSFRQKCLHPNHHAAGASQSKRSCNNSS
ncbi:hypothetical protein TNCT_509671 [Trichonephila clavata]|uniref:Uncharacterized protein n=1 Tax=Trichonephila clavata TaxID=2740835 RepID=A0A8X6HP07_TRICU|nr:hypothetical protein TNCT_509671 [Trichonephila clavata]